MCRQLFAAELAAGLGELCRTLETLSFDEGRLVRWATQRETPCPANSVEIVAAKVGGTGLPLAELWQFELGPDHGPVSA